MLEAFSSYRLNRRSSRLQVTRQRSKPFSGDREERVANRRRVAAHFKRMQERPSVKKLFACEREVNEGFAKTA
jgi:hypothetical protein